MASKKEDSFSWSGVLSMITEAIKSFKSDTIEQFETIKKKVVHYGIVYGLFIMALFFILVGFIKYLAEIYIVSSEGVGFMIVGSVMIVILAAYSLIARA